MKLKKSTLTTGLYLESLIERNPSISTNALIRLTLDENTFKWEITHSIYSISSWVASARVITFENGEAQTFDLAVDAIKFFTTIKAMVDDDVSLTVAETLKVFDSKTMVRLPLMDVRELPNIPTNPPENAPAYRYSGDFFDKTERLPQFTRDDTTVWSGIFLLNKDNGNPIFVASDRSMVYTIKRPTASEAPLSIILPKETIGAISKLGLTHEDSILITSNEARLYLSWAKTNGEAGQMMSRVIGGNLPRLESVLSVQPKYSLTVDVKELTAAVKLFSQLTDLPIMTISVVGTDFVINNDLFTKVVHFTFNSEAPTSTLDITVDVKKTTAVLTALPSDIVKISFDNDVPYVIFDTEDGSAKVLLAKVRRF